MSAPASSLEGLRRRIDGIDERIQDLLIERTEVVAEIAQIKRQGNGVSYRPGREAEVLRRLVRRHRGPLPKASLVRIWREVLGAGTRQQTDFRAAAVRASDGGGTHMLARDHFGVSVPLQTFGSPGQVVAQVADGKASVGIVPLPIAEEPTPWWPQLLRQADGRLKIVARLPFAGTAAGVEAYVLAAAESETTGEDRGVLALESDEPLSRARLVAALEAVALPPAILAGDAASQRAGRSLYLADVAGAPTIESDRIERLREFLAPLTLRVVVLGGYAEPLRHETP